MDELIEGAIAGWPCSALIMTNPGEAWIGLHVAPYTAADDTAAPDAIERRCRDLSDGNYCSRLSIRRALKRAGFIPHTEKEIATMSNHHQPARILGKREHYAAGFATVIQQRYTSKEKTATLQVRRVTPTGDAEQVQIEICIDTHHATRTSSAYFSLNLTPEIAAALAEACLKPHAEAQASIVAGAQLAR